ncbi:YheC/YheD family protein [Oceanobacillus jeddahense]|uniref:YheC/YheD family protein n=1 Tax=Oceanobacillus jeddahense TaxID=1462527 RepID=UPI000595B199|nr:YheC/YheD family protein [Oceanobacillus jeddahense]
MSKIKEKENFQILNIISTLIEATEHFLQLIKQKEMKQSIYLFSSIVEGVGSIENVTNKTQSIDEKQDKEKVQKSLLLIAQELEKDKLIKISEIAQFSLLPQLRRWKKRYEAYELDVSKQPITIGVYLSSTNPLNTQPKSRIHALLEEGKKQNASLVFFCSDDINFKTKKINGTVFQNGSWQQMPVSFPEVVYNVETTSRRQQNQIEKKLRKEIPFTNFGIGNKYYFPDKLIRKRKYAELLAPFRLIKEEATVYHFLDKNKKAVIKPILGRQGLRVFLVEKKGGHYFIQEGKKERVVGQKKFNEWIQAILAVKNNDYIIQNYIEARTKDGEPFDIRAHVQKNSEGKWQMTKIYPRIGHRQSILSNISQGGRTEELATFLDVEFGDKGSQYAKDLKKLALDLILYVDKLMDFSLSDMGIDLTIDKSGRFWMHEINNGPESRYHQQDWATNTIGYAIYIAKNGIYTTNEFQKRDKIRGEFNARTVRLPVAELDNESITIGMLVSEFEEDVLAVRCAYVAKYEGKQFYYFTPKDIDFDAMLIRGYFYEDKKWVPKVVRYPDVVYDRLRLLGIEEHKSVTQILGDYKSIYDEMDDIPFTNEFYGSPISKLEVYDKLQATGELDDFIIPYQKVTRTRDVLDYIERYGIVIIKPRVGTFAEDVHFVSKIDTGKYVVAEKENKKYYNELSLTTFLSKKIKAGDYLVQKYIETRTLEGNPFDIRVHLMKDGTGEWSIIKSFPRIGLNYATITRLRHGGYRGQLEGFVQRNFGEVNPEKIIASIDKYSYKTARVFESLFMENVAELAFDLAIDKEGNIFLIEVNVNKPGIATYEFEVAQHAIPYASYLAETHKKIEVGNDQE